MADESTNTSAPADTGTVQQTADTTANTAATAAPGAATTADGQAVVASANPTETTSTTTEATAPEAKPVVPEKYELKLAEGSLLTAEAVQEVEALAREAGLSAEHAQKLLDARESAVQGHIERLTTEHGARVEQWNNELKADPEVGGTKFETSLRNAEKVLNKFGDEQLRKDLEASGYGSHPGLFKMLARAAAVISDDVFEPAGSQPAGKQGGTGWYTHPTSQHAA